MARLVLVHGAFGGAWCWEQVVGGLEAAGHSVEALDLPGSGNDQTLLEKVTLDAYAECICAALAERPERSVLVGHSMGGVAITQAAGRCPGQIALLVYVAAFLPREGQSLLNLTQLPEGRDDQVQANLVVAGDPPVAAMPAAAARHAVFGSCDDEQAEWACERMRPQAVAPFATPVRIDDPAALELPRAYVICSRDRAIPPALQRRMTRETPCRDVIEIDTDHSPWLSTPDELVAVLDRLAGSASQ